MFVLDKTLWKVFRTSSNVFGYYRTSMKNTGTVTFINWKMLAGILLNSALLWSEEYLLWRSKRLLFTSKICKILQIMQKPNTVMIYYSFKMFHTKWLIQIPLNLTQFKTLGTKSNFKWLVWSHQIKTGLSISETICPTMLVLG